NLAGGSSGDEQQRFGGRRAGKLIQLPSQITGSVAGAAADDRQRRRMSLCQSLDPLASAQVTGELVPAKPKPWLSRPPRYGQLRNCGSLARKGVRIIQNEFVPIRYKSSG